MDNIIKLNDGTNLEIKISFATLYYIQKGGIDKLIKKKDIKKMSDSESMEVAARMIHAILRSNGRTVTFDEALMLTPADTSQIKMLFEEFGRKMEDYKKKETSKTEMQNFTKKKKKK